jgi:hypothetical protein
LSVTFGVFLSGITALAGLGLLVKALRDRIKTNRAQSWPTAEGKVLESKLREVRDDDSRTWGVHIVYEYCVNGETYRSDVWRLEAGSSSFTGNAEKVIARYPAGSTVPVFYNPDAPQDALLEPGKMSWWLFLGGACFLVYGVAAMITNLHRYHTP